MRFLLSSRHKGKEFIYLMHWSKKAKTVWLFFETGTKTNIFRKCTASIFDPSFPVLNNLKYGLCIMDNESLQEWFTNFAMRRPPNWHKIDHVVHSIGFCTRVPHLNRFFFLMFNTIVYWTYYQNSHFCHHATFGWNNSQNKIFHFLHGIPWKPLKDPIWSPGPTLRTTALHNLRLIQ